MAEGHVTPNLGHIQPLSDPRGAASAASELLSQSLLLKKILGPFQDRFEWCITMLEDGKRVGKLFFSREEASLFINGNEIDTGKLIMLSTLDIQNLRTLFPLPSLLGLY